jgi:uncharacterized phiE125 gp8 family phage protein
LHGLTLITAPTFEPVTLAMAKAHVRVDTSDEDTLITAMVTAARAYLEGMSGRAIGAQTLRLDLAEFPEVSRSNPFGAILVPRPPLASVTSIQYYDTAGTLQTLSPSAYQVNTARQPGEVRVAPGGDWPNVQDDRVAAVQVTYVAGEATADAIDPRIKQAVLLLVGHWYEQRETVLVGSISKPFEHAIESICWQLWDGRLT